MTGGAFDTVLVANRGEIAVRVLHAAREAGYRTVAVYSDADRDAPHTRLADVAYRLGPAAASESYLDIERVVAAARDTGAGAVHPGYGFLAENADFARACHDAALIFVGPPAEAIRLMGDKAAAKRRMADAGVPLLAGYQGEDQSDERLRAEAERIGFPVMVKAAAGGGGKGMRLVARPEDLTDALAGARREAAGAFGSDTLILERALQRPRHVEIQVLADGHGHVVALGERDCSVQRRHQKVIEEAPSPAIDESTRAAMQAAAVLAAREIDYVGAGTVEFLLGEDGEFAFLEMNTRLQVEHPVTELVTGIDLVDWQLRIAAGERLDVTQDDVRLDGHAIEARLYAEDPAAGYLPQTGEVLAWGAPQGPGIRVDAGVADGFRVTAHYDPMLAKVIAHGRDRDQARRRLAGALDRLVCLGVTTNRTFLAAVLRHPVFAGGEATTAFLSDHPVDVREPSSEDLALVAGWRRLQDEAAAARRSPGLAGWTNAPWRRSTQRLRVRGDDEVVEVVVSAAGVHRVEGAPPADGADVVDHGDGGGGSVDVEVGGTVHAIAMIDGRVRVDGRFVDVTVFRAGPDRTLARRPQVDLDVTDVLGAPSAAAAAGGAGVLTAPMHGAVTTVEVTEGDEVAEGDPVVVVEAMKMEHVVRADIGGRVAEVVEVGAQVADGDVVARIVPDEPDGAGDAIAAGDAARAPGAGTGRRGG